MNTGTRNLKKAKAIAQECADRNQIPYRVFMPYMPSVYPVGKSPLFVDAMPSWWHGRVAAWEESVKGLGGTVVWPKTQRPRRKIKSKNSKL